jgi:hypothetical protein
MPELYEFEVTGRIGPLMRSCIPELTPTAEDQPTVLTGTARSPEDLQRVLDLLDTHGLPAQDIRISYRDESAAPPG